MTYSMIFNTASEKKGNVILRLPCCSRTLQEIQVQEKQTDLILLDFSKVFDKDNHSKLIWKLHQYGIRGNALSWIRAFLGIRSQMVVIEGEESGSVLVRSWVPQAYPISCFHKRPPRKALIASAVLCWWHSSIPNNWRLGWWDSATKRPG